MATIHKALPLFGGASLNFNVVGGVSEPANAKENTIWVETPIPVSKWSLSGKEPTSPIDGQVWVETLNFDGKVSFNALMENAIDVHANKAFQWDGAEWVLRTACAYQNGSSIQISNGDVPDYLYSAGTWNTTHLTGFSNATESATKFNVSAGTSAQGSTSSKTVTATSNESIDWSGIEYVTFSGAWHGHTDQGGATKSSSLTIKIGDQVIPLNQKTKVEATGMAPITISVYVYVNAYWADANGNYAAFGVVADVDITSIITE